MVAAVVDPCRVYFDKPVFAEIGPPKPAGRASHYSYHEITDIVKKLRTAGWDVRAIVVERKFYSNGLPASYDMALPKNWGFVTELRSSAVVNQIYYPLKVRWVAGHESNHWPEDLFLLYESETQTDLEHQMKAQLDSDPPV